MTENGEISFREKWAALILAITALATAWSAYQASLWNGVQILKIAAAQSQETTGSQEALAENQQRTIDGIQVITIASALAEGRNATVDFMVPRIRADLRSVIQAWLDTDPIHNKNSPPHPLLMPEYTETIQKKFREHQAFLTNGFNTNMSEAQNAGDHGDGYVLLTVLFATVLFFAGISSTFHSHKIERILLFIATCILVVTLGMLWTLPVSAG